MCFNMRLFFLLEISGYCIQYQHNCVLAQYVLLDVKEYFSLLYNSAKLPYSIKFKDLLGLHLHLTDFTCSNPV